MSCARVSWARMLFSVRVDGIGPFSFLSGQRKALRNAQKAVLGSRFPCHPVTLNLPCGFIYRSPYDPYLIEYYWSTLQERSVTGLLPPWSSPVTKHSPFSAFRYTLRPPPRYTLAALRLATAYTLRLVRRYTLRPLASSAQRPLPLIIAYARNDLKVSQHEDWQEEGKKV